MTQSVFPQNDRKHTLMVITGGAGFIGSHLVDHYLKEGFRVLCIDNLITGNLKNISIHEENPQFQFLNHDVTKPIELPKNIQKVGAVLHLASPASPIDYLQHPIATLKVGSLGTHNALGLAKKHNARFLLASTSEIYGDPLEHPQTESYWGNVNPIGPRGVYDEAKRFGEALTMAYHRTHGLDTKIVRIFNTYGPRMRLADGRAIPAFLGQALRGENLTVFGEGRQTRSFCYVSDLVAGMVRLIESDLHEPVNLGNPDEMTILELAQHIQTLVVKQGGPKTQIEYQGLPVDDPQRRRPDISRAQKFLKWQPEVSFSEGIEQTLAYFREKVRSS